MRRRSWAVATLFGSLLLGACGADFIQDAPPPVTVRSSTSHFDLRAWAYCFGNTCADDVPPVNPAHIGDPAKVIVEFPLPGWSFTAFFAPAGGDCERAQQIPVEALGNGRFVLRPAGHAGTYDVTLVGKGDGDLSVTFRWTTPRDGTLHGPRVRWPCSPSTMERSMATASSSG